jgi:GH35 family endo-1,4-beta-xylanase
MIDVVRNTHGRLGVAVLTMFLASVAWGQSGDWKQQANDGIRALRQRDTEIRVLDSQGLPRSGVTVEVKQTSKRFPFGAALSPTVLRDEKYQKFFLEHYNWAVFENDMKWYSNEGRRGVEDYSRADAMLKWCTEHTIPVRGHCIYWEPEKWQPRWLRELNGEELRSAVERRIDSVMTRYQGKVVHWDVNNEMLHGTFFRDRLGEGIHGWMYKRAHEIDPTVKLFVNEFNILSVDKDFQATQVDEYVAQIRQLLNADAPIHGVGIQGHVWSKTVLEHPETLRKNLDKVAELGLPIWISEFDCAFDEEAANADCLEAVYRTAYGHPAVEGIVAWVFWAGNSWRGPNAGLARRDWSLNAAGERYEALMKEWSTDVLGVTDAEGRFAFRGFHGDYVVTIQAGSEEATRKTFRLEPGQAAEVVQIIDETP